MSPLHQDVDGLDTHAPAPAVLAAMCRWAERAGWEDIAQALRERPLCLEQEALHAALPHDGDASR